MSTLRVRAHPRHHRSSLIRTLAAIGALAALWWLMPAARAGDMNDAAKALMKVDDEWSKSTATRDLERIASFYAADAIVYPPGEPMAVGREAARKIWAAMLEDPNFTIAWKPLHAEVAASGDLGYTTGTYLVSFKGPGQDGAAATENGKYASVWKKQGDGSWKAIHDIWNADAD